MTIKLYSWPMSSGTRIAWALEELALPYDYVHLDAKKQEHRSPEMLAVNPHGKVPALDDGGLKLFESGAIGYSPAARWRSSYFTEGLYTAIDPAFAVDLWQGEIGFTIYERVRSQAAARGAPATTPK